MTEQYSEQRAYQPGNEPRPPQPRRRVRGHARPIVLADTRHQPYSDRLTEEDEALLGYPDVSPDRLRSSLVRRGMPYQDGDVDVMNIIVTPRRTAQSAGLQQQSRRVPGSKREGKPPRRVSSTPALLPAPSRRRLLLHRLHHLGTPLALVLGMSIMIGLVVLVITLGPVWQGWQDTFQYGYPRTYQVDAVVGHDHDSATYPSHFLAENLHGTILVIEFPAGSIAHAIAYNGPTLYGTGADTTPVTLTFKDVTGDGAPDMIIHAGATLAVFVNDPAHNDFRPLRPGDHVSDGTLSLEEMEETT
jgi:hypothetical protein